MSSRLKREFLELLKEDEEFRYAVAGLIGLEEILKRLDRHEEEIAKLREDMIAGFRRHDEEIAKLREDMIRGFALIERRISALGARWGLESEDAFREGLRGLLEKELGLSVERWEEYDDEGIVHGYPSVVEVDVAVKDGKVILIEVSSHIRTSDIVEFKRKGDLYLRKTGKRPDRMLIVTPYVDPNALKAAERLNVEVYTKV